jgi:hypothetical protein
VGDVAERTDGERVHDVEGGHVDDHSAGAEFPYALHQRLAELGQVRVRQRGLDRRDEIVALL